MSEAAETVVIGLGNVVLSDDGLGVHLVRRLRERYEIADGVELIEGGTAGLLLLPYVTDARRVILVDAIDTGARPGTLVRLAGEAWAAAFAIRMTPHDVGLADLLGAVRLCGAGPEELMLWGAQPASTRLGTELTTAVAAALDPLADAITAELAGWGAHMHSAAAATGAPLESQACA